MLKELGPAFRIVLLFTVLTGLIYPALSRLVPDVFQPQANGSLVMVNGQIMGSSLIGQNFSKPEYFQPRPSAPGNTLTTRQPRAAPTTAPPIRSWWTA